MATFNGGRMVALFLCVLFALNVSFAQDGWVTVPVYMVDPIDEEVSQGVEDYIEKWKDPLTWETFERDFTPAREAQLAQVAQDNANRNQAAANYLKEDLEDWGDGTSSWFPSFFPLSYAETAEDSLFKNIINLEGALYDAGPQAGQRQTLREFFGLDFDEPNGLKADGTQDMWSCDATRQRCRKDLISRVFAPLVAAHDESQASDEAPRIISFTVKVRISDVPPPPPPPSDDRSFAAELNEEGNTKPRPPGDEDGIPSSVEFDYDSIRLLQPAAMDPDIYVIDLAPYLQPAAKPAASAEASSWGRIKATFADD